MSRWLTAGGYRIVQVQILLLHRRHLDIVRRVVGKGGMRLSLSIWVVTGASSQDSKQEIQHETTSHFDIPEILGSGCVCVNSAIDRCQRGGDG